MNLIQTLNKEQAEKLSAGKTIPDFEPGDTVIVNVKVVEGERTRIQAYEGVCIGRSGHGLNESFTVRKISYGEGVERVFPLLSPMIDFDQAGAPRQGAPRQALLPAQSARQVGPHRRGHASRRPEHGRRRRRGVALRTGKAATRPALQAGLFVVADGVGWLYLGHVECFQCCTDRARRPRAPAGPFLRPADGVDPGRALSARSARPHGGTAASRFNLYQG